MQPYTLQGALKLETDSDLLVQSPKFMLHSSRAALPTATARKYGASLVTGFSLTQLGQLYRLPQEYYEMDFQAKGHMGEFYCA